jgi:MFS family permease
MRVLRRKPSFWALSLGAAASSMMGYGMFFWMPSFLVRSFDLGLLQASLAFGAIVLVGGLIGIWLGGAVADRLGQRRKSVYALAPAIAFLTTTPFYVTGVLSTTLWMTAALMLVPTALGLAWLGPVLTAIQHIVPPNMRVTSSAIFLFINNLLGIGLGTPLIGALSDAMHVRFGAESLRYAIVAGSGFYLVAAAFLLFASRRLEADWER